MKSLLIAVILALTIASIESQSPDDNTNGIDTEADLSDDEIFDQFNEKFKIPSRRGVNAKRIKEALGKRYRSMREHNRRFREGNETFERALYPTSYLGDVEIARYYLGAADPDPDEELTYANNTDNDRRGRLVTPPEDYFEWGPNIVGKVKNQGQCGSCYVFAALGVIKSRRVIKYGGSIDTYDLSEQDAMECTRGCNGGWEYSVYRDYSQAKSGCAAYNYGTAHSYLGYTNYCTASSRPRVPNTKVLSYYYVQNNEKSIREALVNYGPLYTRFDVYSNFYDYKTGIYSKASGNYLGGHAIMLTGYGTTTSGQKYWILKNSWDTWWGEAGYFRMSRGINLCGIEGRVSYVNL